jgi:hypothetical protein
LSRWHKVKKAFSSTLTRWRRPGKYARSYVGEDVHSVEVHWHFNGSGKDAFGGCDKWPVVSIEVPFEEGKESLADEFAARMRDFIDQTLEELGVG